LTPRLAPWETANVLEPTTSPLQPGDPETLGRYRVVSRLGSGGMGTVYLASAPDGLRVAIKVIRPELARDPAFRARFGAEVDAARRVTASCTARVLDAEPAAPLPWFVTEYVEGTPLDRLVAAQGPLPPSSVEGLAVGVAAALTAIHAAGLVHRDLKPGNVLVSPFGPKVIDFGIARALDTAGSVTINGMVLGTPGWMAPEQLAGRPASPAGDIFAWGCLVGFAASGVPPFGKGPPEVVAQRVAWQPPELAGVPAPLRGLVAAATDRDPERRPAARGLLLELLGDRAADDPHAAVTQALQRTWIAPAPAWGAHATAARGAPPGWEPAARGAPPGWEPAARGAPPAGWQAPPAGGVQPARRRWYRRKRYLVLLLLVGLLLLAALNRADGRGSAGEGRSEATRSGGGRSPASSASTRPAGGATGQRRTVRDGKLEFTVTSVSCGHQTVGKPPLEFRTSGQFCLVRLQVRNIGHESWQVPPNQYLVDSAGGRHAIDVRGGLAVSSQRLLEQLGPGQRVAGTLVFELPRNARPERLVLHDSLLSGGATYRVPGR
jgi:predicted Ser/Thr protein kinase